jgi:SAM-dependent methyltransferase
VQNTKEHQSSSRLSNPGNFATLMAMRRASSAVSTVIMKRRAAELVGVDLSAEMIELAQARKIYDRLEVAEITGWIEQGRDVFDLIVSTDCLIYFGGRIRPRGLHFRDEVRLHGIATHGHPSRRCHAGLHFTEAAPPPGTVDYRTSAKRRQFIAGLGSVAAWPLAARVQQPAVPLAADLVRLSSPPMAYLRLTLLVHRSIRPINKPAT